MQIRRYRPGEEAQMWRLFSGTVRNVNIRDYSLQQVRAWAPDEWDETRWQDRIRKMDALVCVTEGIIVGYAGWHAPGFIDHFYVHCDWQGRGVGKRLMAVLEAEARSGNVDQMTADVSITARPFFESQGFRVVAAQDVEREGVVLRNFRMTRPLE
jgi:putative acetyltransferase